MRTSKSSRHLNSVLFLCFEKKFFGVESWNIILNFSIFSVGGCWGQPMSFFWKLFEETQIPKLPEATRHHSLIKWLLLPLLRADLLISVHSETPCSYVAYLIFKKIKSDQSKLITKECKENGIMLLVDACWLLLAAGCWLLVAVCFKGLLAAGCWLL